MKKSRKRLTGNDIRDPGDSSGNALALRRFADNDSRDLGGDSGDGIAKKPVEVVVVPSDDGDPEDSQSGRRQRPEGCICPGRETRGGRLVFTDAICPAHARMTEGVSYVSHPTFASIAKGKF